MKTDCDMLYLSQIVLKENTMRCGCPDCGNYMIQRERGLFSGCACPACGASCTDCMGTEQAPLETCELSMQAQLRAKLRELEEQKDQ